MCKVIMNITKPNGLAPIIGDEDDGRLYPDPSHQHDGHCRSEGDEGAAAGIECAAESNKKVVIKSICQKETGFTQYTAKPVSFFCFFGLFSKCNFCSVEDV